MLSAVEKHGKRKWVGGGKRKQRAVYLCHHVSFMITSKRVVDLTQWLNALCGGHLR